MTKKLYESIIKKRTQLVSATANLGPVQRTETAAYVKALDWVLEEAAKADEMDKEPKNPSK